MSEFGTLERVELRDVWANEAQNFTPWLAKERNLKVLASVLGIGLELEAEEQEVGPFRADILCRNSDDDSWVLIENQLERTDHIHLGQLLTYAAGLDAVNIVWLAKEFNDEHRAALDWLNKITDDAFQFFGLEVELWRIGTSPVAPKFNVVSKPNNWSRSVSKVAREIASEGLTETRLLQLEYWTAFSEYLNSENSSIKPRKPSPQHWVYYGAGRSGFQFATLLDSRKDQLGVGLNLSHDKAKACFDLLSEQKDEIHAELGFELDWMRLPEKKASRIAVYRNDSDLSKKEAWPTYQQWMKDKLEKLKAVFSPRIRDLYTGEWDEVDD